MDGDAFEKKYNTLGLDILQTQKLYCREVLKLLPGQMAVISNGRVRLLNRLGAILSSYNVIFFISFLFNYKYHLPL